MFSIPVWTSKAISIKLPDFTSWNLIIGTLAVVITFKPMTDLVPLFQLATLLEEHKLSWRNDVKHNSVL